MRRCRAFDTIHNMKILLFILLGLIGLVIAVILFVIICSLFINPHKEYGTNSPFYRWLLNFCTGAAVFILRIRIHTTGLEKVPEGRFLLVGNHRSNFDPILTWWVLRDRQLAFLSKEENFHVPAFGRIIRKCGFLEIDRSDPRASILTLKKAADMIKQDIVSMMIYPEGTRSKECVLLPFHDGIFRVAQMADVPIVNVAIRGTEQIHKRYIRHRTDVYIDFVDFIPKEEVKKMRTHEIGERIRNGLLTTLEGEKSNE